MSSEEHDSAEQAAAVRRERLRALRAAQDLLSTPDGDDAGRASADGNDAGMGPQLGPAPAPSLGGKQGIEDGPVGVDREREHEIAAEDTAAQATLSRLERLKALREAKQLLSMPDGESIQSESRKDMDDAEEDLKPTVKFRNYVPHDKELHERKIAPPVLPKFDDPVAGAPAPEKIEDPFLNIAPKKPNSDLRRDVQKRLDKLERRTQKAIYQLYLQQERESEALEGEGNGAAE